jgi:sugar phosphate isomerase/epimerase
MFAWTVRGRGIDAYAPGWDPRLMDCGSATLDFSHAALSRTDALEMATALGTRLRHVHLCDGAGPGQPGKVFDEHLIPGRGGQPVAQTLAMLAERDWSGSLVAEINMRSAKTDVERLAMLGETLDFARRHTRRPAPVAG